LELQGIDPPEPARVGFDTWRVPAASAHVKPDPRPGPSVATGRGLLLGAAQLKSAFAARPFLAAVESHAAVPGGWAPMAARAARARKGSNGNNGSNGRQVQ